MSPWLLCLGLQLDFTSQPPVCDILISVCPANDHMEMEMARTLTTNQTKLVKTASIMGNSHPPSASSVSTELTT